MALIHQLIDENIIIPAVSCSGDEPVISQGSQVNISTSKDDFTNPVLEKFTDMADLLLLDPIHEVDESGWPNKPPDSEK